MTAPSASPLASDLVAGLNRLKLACIRAMARPPRSAAGQTQRWTPEELLCTFVEAEITARGHAAQRLRHKAAGFPVRKTLEELKGHRLQRAQATFDYLDSLEWIRAAENLCLVGLAGTWQVPPAGRTRPCRRNRRSPGPLPPAAKLVETVYQGLADDSVGREIDRCSATTWSSPTRSASRPRHNRHPAAVPLPAAAYEHRSLGTASHWPFDQWDRFLPEHTTAVSMLDRLIHHATVVVIEGESFRMKEARAGGGGHPTAPASVDRAFLEPDNDGSSIHMEFFIQLPGRWPRSGGDRGRRDRRDAVDSVVHTTTVGRNAETTRVVRPRAAGPGGGLRCPRGCAAYGWNRT
jgi:hypothetical protein